MAFPQEKLEGRHSQRYALAILQDRSRPPQSCSYLKPQTTTLPAARSWPSLSGEIDGIRSARSVPALLCPQSNLADIG